MSRDLSSWLRPSSSSHSHLPEGLGPGIFPVSLAPAGRAYWGIGQASTLSLCWAAHEVSQCSNGTQRSTS